MESWNEMMRLDKFVIRHIAMKLKNPFQTVNGKVETRESLIVRGS